jgi:transcriptional regulator with XRE-family HTH domain
MIDKGLRLKELREQKGMSQTEAARHIGVSKQTLYKYENNIITNIPSDIIERIAVLYETTPAYLMGWQEQIDKLQKSLEPLTEQMAVAAKRLTESLKIPTVDMSAYHNLEESVKEICAMYDASEINQALKFTRAFLKATPDQQKIALEILQLHREDS